MADAGVDPPPIAADAIVESTWALVDEDPAVAARVLAAATRMEPEMHALWNMLGRARARAGDRAAFERGLALAPANAVSRRGLAENGHP